MILRIISLACVLSLTSCAQTAQEKPGLTAEQKKASSGNQYTILTKGAYKMKFTTVRPNKKDTNVLLCIAAAFTTLDSGKVDGLYVIGGEAGSLQTNKRLGGAILIDSSGNGRIFPFNTKHEFDQSLIDTYKWRREKSSFFQQIQLIVNGQAEKFKDTKLFQRRAIVTFKDNSTAIIESKEAVTLATFSTDLVELGVYNALYTDMGGWDEGWYRDKNGKQITIGTARSHTALQSNWVIFTR